MEQSDASSIETFQKAGGDLHMRVTVTRGRPNTWKVEGHTLCADAA